MSEKTLKNSIFSKIAEIQAESNFHLDPPPRNGISLSTSFKDDTRFKRFFEAFSIVELMISLVIISLVVAAFTPVITKKMQNKTTSGSTQNPDDMDDETIAELKAKTADMFLPFDAVAGKTKTNSDGSYFKCGSAPGSGVKTITCKVKIPSDHVSIVMVGAGGGGTAAGQVNVHTTQKNLTSWYNDDLYLYPNIRDVIILTANGDRGEYGGTIYRIDYETETEYIKNCPAGTSEITTGSGNKFCVTNYNVRPDNYENYHFNYSSTRTKIPQSAAMEKEFRVNIPEGVLLADSTTNSEYTYIKTNKSPACWVAPSTGCAGSSGDYPRCGRTVCNWYAAANVLCPELELGGNNCSDDGINFNKPCKGRWRIMTYNEISANLYGNFGFGGMDYLYNIITHYSSPLFEQNINIQPHQTCSSNSSGCNNVANTCEGTDNSYCYPSRVWAASKNDTEAYTYNSGSYINSYKEAAHSVRCVMQKAKGRPLHTHIEGGAGGTTAQLKNLKIPQELLDKCTSTPKCRLTDEVELYKGGYYKGMLLFPNETNIAKEGLHGANRLLLLKDAYQNIVWGYKVEGGQSGKPAVLNPPGDDIENAIPGEGGEGGKLCWKNINNTGWSEAFDCEEEGVGIHGTKGIDGQIKKFREKVENDFYTVYNSSPWAHPFPRTAMGIQTTYVSSQTEDSTRGLNSTVKWSELTYGGGGGAGGGGAFAHIKNIPITPNKEYEIIIGGGGANAARSNYLGSKGANGTNGGDTKITLDNNTILIAHGGGGGGGARSGNWTGTNGEPGSIGIGGKFEASSDSETINSILNSKDSIKHDGTNAKIGTQEPNYLSIGGSGGVSGISLATKIVKHSMSCGGFYKDENSGCNNENDANAVSPAYLSSLKAPVKHIYLDGNYGSYGAGGGGGGTKYENGVVSSGIGSAGQGGYVYFYWNK